jgi:hypothetical protein
VAALVAALLVVPAAFALRVHVRVEGKSRTIYGSAEPSLQVGTNALDALESASVAGEFYYHVTATSFGPYVDQIGRYVAGASTGWVFKVNGVSPQVGADKVTLKDGDVVLWYYATFGNSGGPPTLELQRLPANCYVVESVNDTGKRARAANATLLADGKRFRTKSGRACIGRHTGLVRATAPGAVRSNAQQ